MVILLLAACGKAGNDGGSGGTASGGNSQGSGGGSSQNVEKQVKLSMLVGSEEQTVKIANALVAAFEERNPNIKIELEHSPGGSEGDNLLKTRLATGDMNDIFFYNSGSLLQAINPEQNLVPLTNDPFMAGVEDSFKQVVTYKGEVYGVPYQSAGIGGIFYNKKVYEKLGLSVPKTWDEFMANVEKVKREGGGIAPVIGTFKDTWTSQLLFLSDYYNVQSEYPNFAEDYTANKAKFATTPIALKSFRKMEDLVGYWNDDYLASTLDVGIRKLALGEGAHYPMFGLIIPTILQNNPENLDDIGFFGVPGDDPNDSGATVWMPNAVYIYKNTEHPEEAKKFVEFVASVEGQQTVANASPPNGPMMVKGVQLPEDTPRIVKEDMMGYIESGKNTAALEFLSPVKGPNLEHILIQIGIGQISAEEGAGQYDKDVEKQAMQLGLEGW